MGSLVSIDNLNREQAEALLDQSRAFVELSERKVKKAPTLRGRTIVNMFFEHSTRTRSSFELAGKRLSADVINFSASSSSTSKGESVLETARTLQAMNPDAIVVRHHRSGVPAQLVQDLGLTVINAGDGTNEHPTQALLDAYTIINRCGRIEGLQIAIVGDIVRSRVARSDTKLLTKLGAQVRWVGPETLLPHMSSGDTTPRFTKLHEGIQDADVVIMLRIQHERADAAGPYITDTDDYSRSWGLNRSKLQQYAPNAVIMHPGPVNIGVETHRELIDGPESMISEQVKHGVGVRMAVLYHCIGTPDDKPVSVETDSTAKADATEE